MTSPYDEWIDSNQRYLTAELGRIKALLERRVNAGAPAKAPGQEPLQPTVKEIEDTMRNPPALEVLCDIFRLTSFERDLLLLCAGMELDSAFARLCSAARGSPELAYPTFGLALAALPEPHWSALSPEAPLRRWHLLEMAAGPSLTQSPLHIDERILHYLTGLRCLDERLAGLVMLLEPRDDLTPSAAELADKVVTAWLRSGEGNDLPVIQLCGDDIGSQRKIVAAACAMLGLGAWALPANALPTGQYELDTFLRIWQRETALSPAALLLDCTAAGPNDAAYERAVAHFIERAGGMLVVAVNERRQAAQRPMVTFDVGKPTADEQHQIWTRSLGQASAGQDDLVDMLVSQFSLGEVAIVNAAREALGAQAPEEVTDSERLGRELWKACLARTRPKLDRLAQRIEPAATWEDLVLPETQLSQLREIAIHVRQRARVYGRWGFATRGTRGLGISALFVGVSGTGKTMAAEVLARELELDLYRIDLSQVVSKYIGETEKNLRQVFDAAEAGGAILLFDEADALFGKRSEVKDSHDRYANIEISYLLQRMEAYRGLAVLTSNMRSALDTAFLRRIRFVVEFPFPEPAQRSEIWKRVFPGGVPLERVDYEKLARLNIVGGNIRNIALNAAFLAAGGDEPVGMKHLLHAAKREYAKIEKPLTEAEVRGWV